MAITGDRWEKVLRTLDAAWNDFQAAYAELPDEELLVPGVCGAWSVRDLIAHIAWWEEEALAHLPTIAAGGRAPTYRSAYGGIDAFNALMTQRRSAFTLDEVREQAEATHRSLVEYLRGVPEGLLRGDSRFRRRLRLDTYGHYPIHAAQIRAWRASRATEP